jgi:tyrosyl-tRNA synthetase
LSAVGSTSEARRLISQKAVKIDSEPISSINYDCSDLTEFLLQIGKKKAYKILLR